MKPKFLLISDIHADTFAQFASIDPKTGMSSRLVWCLKTIRQAREYARDNEIKTVIIPGDLFNKRGVIDVIVYDAVFKELETFAEDGIEVLAIPGNHDQAIKNGKVHSLSPLPIVVIDNWAITEIDGKKFGFIAFCENPHEFLEKLAKLFKKSPVDFLIIHQGVNGAKIAGDEILSRDETSVADIRAITGEKVWIFSGHYHIHQKVDPRFYYVGSALPKDFGDTTPKGFLIFEDGQLEQIESVAPKFVRLDESELEKRKADVEGNYVQVMYDSVEPEKIAKHKPAGFIAVKKKVDREYSTRTAINPELSPQKILKQYVKEQASAKAFDGKELDKALNLILEGSNLDRAGGGHKIEVLDLEAENFMSYKKLAVDFTKFSGLTLIEGDNLDDDSALSNGSGKSLIPEAIKWAIFGTTARGVTGDEVVRNAAGKDCRVNLILAVDETTLVTITRHRKHSVHKNSLFFMAQGEDEIMDLRGPTDIETQKKIFSYLGIDENTFDNTVFFGHNFTKSFAALTDKEQKQIFETIMGTEYIQRLEAKAKALSKEREGSLVEASSQLSYKKNFLEKLNEQSAGQDEAFQQFEEFRDKRIAGEEEVIKENEDILKNVSGTKEEKTRLEEIKKEKEGFADVVGMIGKLEKEVDGYSDELEISTTWKNKLEIEKSKIESNIARNSEKIQAAKDELTSLSKAKVCPTCKQDVRPGGMKQHAAELQKKLEALEQEKNSERAKRKKAMEDLEVAGEEIVKLSAVVEESEKLLKELRVKSGSILVLEREELQIRNAIRDIEQKLSSAARTIQLAKNKISEIQAEKNPVENLIKSIAGEIELAELDIAALEERKELFDVQFKALKFWETAFSDKGSPSQSPIKSLLFDSVVPVLDELSRAYSEVLTSGAMEVRFNTVTQLKSGEYRDKFSVDVLNKYGAENYLGDSGGERRKVDLAIMFALHSLARIRSGSQFDVLFLDEILDSLDPEGCNRVMKLLVEIQKDIKKIFVITHNETLKTCFAEKLQVQKKGGVSEVLNG